MPRNAVYVIILTCGMVYLFIIYHFSKGTHRPSMMGSKPKENPRPTTCEELTRKLPKTVPKQNHSQPKEFFDLSHNNFAYLDDIRYIHSPKDLCKRNSGKEKLILIVIMTDTLDSGHIFRRAIRATWANITEHNGWSIRTAFILGISLNADRMANISHESHQYRDIIQGSFSDGYNNLTSKTMTGYRWAQQFCQHASLIMRATHDTVVNIPQFVQISGELFDSEVTRIYLGEIYRNITHYKTGKWTFKCSIEWPNEIFSPYAAGSGFAVSMDLAIELNAMFCRTPFIFPDDNYIGELVDVLGIKPYPSINFQQFYIFNTMKFGRVKKRHIVVHFLRWDSKEVEEHPESLYKQIEMVNHALMHNNK
ncbi:unnamed protein product [Owenia fusiformis]|uniref:Hexosyltransferase n=1 Tax=Owenia fusiformis TaxID=6347 RepID=A0A8S4PU89_OWEFU|nr:unnamed protein product [Owenia fusiformis]